MLVLGAQRAKFKGECWEGQRSQPMQLTQAATEGKLIEETALSRGKW